MASIHQRSLRMIDGLLADVEAGRSVSPGEIRHGRAAIAFALKRGNRARSARRQRRGEQLDARRSDRAEVRVLVVARAGVLCEACGREFTPSNPGELDEFMGGSGRRQQMTTIENCWLIHSTCHREKTSNLPTARHWAMIFVAHCDRYGYAEAAAHVARRFPDLP